MGYFKKFQNFFFGLINFLDPPDHLPMLEASEIVVKVLKCWKYAVFRAYLGPKNSF